MGINSQLKPTSNNESLDGAGSVSFGSEKFAPSFSAGITGTAAAVGSYQVLSRIVFFKVIIQGSFTVAGGVEMLDPISPARFPPGHTLAGDVLTRGMGNIESSTTAPAVTFQLDTGGWAITAGTYTWLKLTGWYWVE